MNLKGIGQYLLERTPDFFKTYCIKLRREFLFYSKNSFRFLYRCYLSIAGFFSKKTFFHSSNDFVLRVAPLRKWTDRLFFWKINRKVDYFPPPSYGIPPGKSKLTDAQQFSQYGLFLWPGKLSRSFFYFILLILPVAVFPFVNPYSTWVIENPFYCGLGFILLVTFLTAFVLRILFVFMIPPVLSKIWQEWPVSQYKKFLTVPHLVKISLNDRDKDKNFLKVNKHYWEPDTATPKRHQTSFYASGMYTLQEVMLHLAIFDFFFHKKTPDDNGKFRSIKVENWVLYLLSPVWASYLLILFLMLLYQLNPPCFSLDVPTLFQYPYNFAWVGIVWFIISSWFILKRIDFLKRQEKAVRKGFYNTHLDLIPQQILKVITQIPDEEQIRGGIEKLSVLLRTLQTVGLVSLFMLVEIFSSPYSQLTPPDTSTSTAECKVIK